jgi:hypothetical protein
LSGYSVGITEKRDSMLYAIEMVSGGMIYIKSFMKIDSGVEEILRFYLSNLKGSNIGIPDGEIY